MTPTSASIAAASGKSSTKSNKSSASKPHAQTGAEPTKSASLSKSAADSTGSDLDLRTQLSAIAEKLKLKCAEMKPGERPNTGLTSSVSEYKDLDALLAEVQAECERIRNEIRTTSEPSASAKSQAHKLHSVKDEEKAAAEEVIIDGSTLEAADASKSESSSQMKEQLKSFIEQYSIRERHFQSILMANEAELQLVEAKLEQQRQATRHETLMVTSLRGQVASFLKTEQELRRQLQTYVDKFKQVEETLNKSNELFSTFRNEMEAMTLRTRALEKENLQLKARVIELEAFATPRSPDKKPNGKSVESTLGAQQLENLCRVLQKERNELRKRLAQYETHFQGLVDVVGGPAGPGTPSAPTKPVSDTTKNAAPAAVTSRSPVSKNQR